MFTISLSISNLSRYEKEEWYTYNMSQIDKILHYYPPLTHFKIESTMRRRRNNTTSPVQIVYKEGQLAIYRRRMEEIYLDLNTEKRGKGKGETPMYRFRAFLTRLNNDDDRRHHDDLELFEKAIIEVTGDKNARNELPKRIQILEKWYKKLLRAEDNEEDSVLRDFKKVKKEVYHSYEMLNAQMKEIIDIVDALPSLNATLTSTTKRIQSYLTRDYNKVSEIKEVLPRLMAFEQQQQGDKMKALENVMNRLLDDDDEEVSVFDDDDDDDDDNDQPKKVQKQILQKSKLLLKESNEVQEIVKGYKAFYRYHFMSSDEDEESLKTLKKNFNEWQIRKKRLYDKFLDYYKAIIEQMNQYSIEKLIKHVDHGDKSETNLKLLIMKSIFNGETQLRFIHGNLSDITFKIESNNLIETFNEENIRFNDAYFVIPSVRYQNVNIRLPRLDKFAEIRTIYPILASSYIHILFDSPLKDDGLSLDGQLHYGTIDEETDRNIVIHAYLQQSLVSKTLNQVGKRFFTLPKSPFLNPNEGETGHDFYAIFKSVDNPPLRRPENQNPTLYIALKESLIGMTFHLDTKYGLLRFNMFKNTQPSTFTINEIMKSDSLSSSSSSSNKNGLHVFQFNDLQLPPMLKSFIERTRNVYEESAHAFRLLKRYEEEEEGGYIKVYLASLYSYYVNYLEVERDKTKRILYGIKESVLYDDWISHCHVLSTTEKKCIVMIYSTFSLSHGIIRIKVQTIMTQEYYDSLLLENNQ